MSPLQEAECGPVKGNKKGPRITSPNAQPQAYLAETT